MSIHVGDLVSPGEAERNSFEIPLRDIHFLTAKDDPKKQRVLGAGSFGVVYLCKYAGTEVAVKKINAEHTTRENLLEDFEHEVNMLKCMRHPNVVLFMGISRDTDAGHMYIVQEFVQGGSLLSKLQKNKNISWNERTRMALEIARSLMYLHGRSCMHRDLKCENILIDASGKCKLADFGLARLFKKELHMNDQLAEVGTPWWRAPEIHTGHYDFSADIFSFGILLLEIITLCLGEDIRINCSYMKKKDGEISFGCRPEMIRDAFAKEISTCPPQLVNLALECIAEEPSERPTTELVMSKLTKIHTGLDAFEGLVKNSLTTALGHWNAKAELGCKVWLQLSLPFFTFDYTRISVPLPNVLSAIVERIKKQSLVTLDDNHKSFLASLLGSGGADSKEKIHLSKFAKFWKWYHLTEALFMHQKLLPLWQSGFIYGFGSSTTVADLLKEKNKNGLFIIRFSKSQPGNLAINCFHSGKLRRPILIEVDRKHANFILGDVRCKSLKDVLKKNNLDQLRTVYPDKPINHPDFIRAHTKAGEELATPIRDIYNTSGVLGSSNQSGQSQSPEPEHIDIEPQKTKNEIAAERYECSLRET